MDSRDEKRIDEQIEDRVDQLWQYVRRYGDSLCREVRCREIREIVETPLPLFAYRIRQRDAKIHTLQTQVGHLRAEVQRLRNGRGQV